MAPEIVRRFVNGAWKTEAAEEGGGGAQPLIDLGVVNAATLLNGPQTLYTPSAGQSIAPVSGPDSYVQIQPACDIVIASAAAGDPVGLVWVRSGSPDATWLDAASRVASKTAFGLYGQPVKAFLVTETNGLPILSATPAWQSAHAYTANALILGPDNHLWSASGGTSAGTIPNFAANEGGSVVDNTITWTDEGAIPTTGSIHLYALVASI